MINPKKAKETSKPKVLASCPECCCPVEYKWNEGRPSAGHISVTDSVYIWQSDGWAIDRDSILALLSEYEAPTIHIRGHGVGCDEVWLQITSAGGLNGNVYGFAYRMLFDSHSLHHGEMVCVDIDYAGALIKPSMFIPIAGTETGRDVSGDIKVMPDVRVYSKISALESGTKYSYDKTKLFAYNSAIPDSSYFEVNPNGAVFHTTDAMSGGITESPNNYLNRGIDDLVTKRELMAARPYLVYSALISQTGTSAPTQVVLENTTGGSITWVYDYDSSYTGFWSLGTLDPVKTFVVFQPGINSMCAPFDAGVQWDGLTNYNIRILNDNGGYDGTLSNRAIEIRIYP